MTDRLSTDAAVTAKLAELGLTLPEAAAPVAAYVPVVENALLPSLDTKPPLLREHRLYQADWLLRFYGFKAQ